MKKIFIIIFACLFCANTVFAELTTNRAMLSSDITVGTLMMKYKDISINLRAIGKLKKQVNKLSQTDKSIIKKYVYGAVKGEKTFLYMNASLRGNLKDYVPQKEISKPLEYRLEYYSDSLAKALAQTKLQQNTILYSVMDTKTLKHIFGEKSLNTVLNQPVSDSGCETLKSALKGKKYTDKGFITAYYDKNHAPKSVFRLQINAPKKLQAVLMDEISGQNNKEILINQGYRWEVTNVQKDYDKKNKQYYYKICVKMY